MANLIKTKRGLNIPINGKPIEMEGITELPKEFALIPDYYLGITPKLLVKEGDQVKAGTPVFFNKQFPGMNFVSPVSGHIKSIHRGERRKIMDVIIESDGKMLHEKFDDADLASLSVDDILEQLQKAGLWAYIKQRPYDVIANPSRLPKSIFISTFDTAPLAPNNDYVVNAQLDDFQVGVQALAKIANVHLGVFAGKKSPFHHVKNVTLTEYAGPHPIGNVGVQINKISPINKGEVVWTINAQDVLFIGRYFNKHIVDLSRLIALTGPAVKSPQYYKTVVGANIEQLVQNKTKGNASLRFISGNVLTGTKISGNGYIDPYATQITVMDEGNDVHELVGWGMPRFRKFSVSHTFFSFIFESAIIKRLFGKMKYKWDARLMGGKRAIIMSGEYEKVLPMDGILPEFLFKAMITEDIDKMEVLGAYEIAPEDVALCEFVCTSKLPLQQIVRNALDLMIKELE